MIALWRVCLLWHSMDQCNLKNLQKFCVFYQYFSCSLILFSCLLGCFKSIYSMKIGMFQTSSAHTTVFQSKGRYEDRAQRSPRGVRTKCGGIKSQEDKIPLSGCGNAQQWRFLQRRTWSHKQTCWMKCFLQPKYRTVPALCEF